MNRGMLKMVNEQKLEEWDSVLFDVMFACDTSVRRGSGSAPNFLVFAVDARVPSEILVGIPQMERTPAAYAIGRYHKFWVAYEVGPEMAYAVATRAKSIIVNQPQCQLSRLVRVTNLIFHTWQFQYVSILTHVKNNT